MTPAELIEAEQVARRYGSANCWTGTSGHLAGWMLRLLVEIKRLKADVPKHDPASPQAANRCRKPKKPRGKTADQRLTELWETEDGRWWLIMIARNVEEVAQRIGKGETQTKGSRVWVKHVRIARRNFRKLRMARRGNHTNTA